jgi:hypothetical protein
MIIYINPLNAQLNPIYHLLALLGAHHILHISRMGVNPLSDENDISCLHTSLSRFEYCLISVSLEKHFQTLSRDCLRCSEKGILYYIKSRKIQECVICLVNKLRVERVKEEL